MPASRSTTWSTRTRASSFYVHVTLMVPGACGEKPEERGCASTPVAVLEYGLNARGYVLPSFNAGRARLRVVIAFPPGLVLQAAATGLHAGDLVYTYRQRIRQADSLLVGGH